MISEDHISFRALSRRRN